MPSCCCSLKKLAACPCHLCAHLAWSLTGVTLPVVLQSLDRIVGGTGDGPGLGGLPSSLRMGRWAGRFIRYLAAHSCLVMSLQAGREQGESGSVWVSTQCVWLSCRRQVGEKAPDSQQGVRAVEGGPLCSNVQVDSLFHVGVPNVELLLFLRRRSERLARVLQSTLSPRCVRTCRRCGTPAAAMRPAYLLQATVTLLKVGHPLLELGLPLFFGLQQGGGGARGSARRATWAGAPGPLKRLPPLARWGGKTAGRPRPSLAGQSVQLSVWRKGRYLLLQEQGLPLGLRLISKPMRLGVHDPELRRQAGSAEPQGPQPHFVVQVRLGEFGSGIKCIWSLRERANKHAAQPHAVPEQGTALRPAARPAHAHARPSSAMGLGSAGLQETLEGLPACMVQPNNASAELLHSTSLYQNNLLHMRCLAPNSCGCTPASLGSLRSKVRLYNHQWKSALIVCGLSKFIQAGLWCRSCDR